MIDAQPANATHLWCFRWRGRMARPPPVGSPAAFAAGPVVWTEKARRRLGKEGGNACCIGHTRPMVKACPMSMGRHHRLFSVFILFACVLGRAKKYDVWLQYLKWEERRWPGWYRGSHSGTRGLRRGRRLWGRWPGRTASRQGRRRGGVQPLAAKTMAGWASWTVGPQSIPG